VQDRFCIFESRENREMKNMHHKTQYKEILRLTFSTKINIEILREIRWFE